MLEVVNTPIVAYKGFNKDMTTCNHFQYEEGKSYHTDAVKVCCSGFHACEQPLFVFEFYPPETSVYHKVELSGTIMLMGRPY